MVWQHLPYFNYHIMDNLKWFKFSPSHWFMGRIQRCSEVSQARFMRLCCIYWTNECVMSIEDAEIELGDDEFKQLLKLRIIEEDNGSLVIKFLDEQYSECIDISKLRSKAAIARWKKAKAKEDNASALQVDASALQDNADKTRQDETILDNTIQETDFDIFWKAYDYNVGLRQAQDEWLKIKREMPNEISKILVHVPLYVASKPDKQHRKKPENYLKEGVYNDEIVPTKELNSPKAFDREVYEESERRRKRVVL